MKQEFELMINRGYYLTPVYPGEKKKFRLKWGVAQYDIGEAKRHTESIGPNDNAAVLVELSKVVVLDVDDVDKWDDFRGENELPETFTVKTTRDGGGFHYYYKRTDPLEEKIPKTICKTHYGFDVKSDGVVTAPGSYIKERDRSNTIVNDIPLVDFPDWIIERLDSRHELVKATDGFNAAPLDNPMAWKDINWLLNYGMKESLHNTEHCMNSRAVHVNRMGKDIGRYGWNIGDIPEEFLSGYYSFLVDLKPEDHLNYETEFLLQLTNGLDAGNTEAFELPDESPFKVEEGMTADEMRAMGLGAYVAEPPTIFLPMDCLEGIGQLIQPGADYSFDLLTRAFCGYTLGATTVIFAPTGQGKTTFVHRELVHLLEQGVPIGFIPTEETPEVAYMNVLKSATGLSLSNISTGDVVKDAELMAERQAAYSGFYTGKQLYIPKDVHKMKLPDVLSFIREMNNRGVKHFFLDNITALAAKSRTNDRKAWEVIEEVVSTVADTMRETQSSMTVIGHTNESKVNVTEYSIKGGQQIPNMVDNVIYMAEAELKPIRDDENLVIADFKVLELLKIRGDGSYKRTRIGLSYNPVTRQISEAPGVLAFERRDRMDKNSELNDPEFKIPVKGDVDKDFPEGEIKAVLKDGLGFNDDQAKRWLKRKTPVIKSKEKKSKFKDETPKKKAPPKKPPTCEEP